MDMSLITWVGVAFTVIGIAALLLRTPRQRTQKVPVRTRDVVTRHTR